MFLFIKILICTILMLFWLRTCKKNLIQSLGHFFFILFIVTLFYDIFALNQKIITIIEKQGGLIHLIIDRTLLLPLSLFFLQNIYRQFFLRFVLSIGWIILYFYLETINEKFNIVKLTNWTPYKSGYIGGYIIILTLIMSYAFDKLSRSSINNAPSN
ncbi:hypothetical protein QFZ87_003193 [Bacillus sp. SLBN-46]|nr:hypothetical protein [Bacillus sp. SLBN-46]